jgi:polo-like kinase 1
MLSVENNENKRVFRDKIKNIAYTKGKLLGTGGFAKCYEAVSGEDGKLYAAKVIPKKSINEKRQRYKLLIEIKIHKSLKHKYIVEFIDAFEDKENIYILLEYCRNYTLKDLAKRRKRLTEFETRIYISQIVKAMIYIHQQGIIHRDLKLGNILINDQMDAKICDFGLSTKIKN